MPRKPPVSPAPTPPISSPALPQTTPPSPPICFSRPPETEVEWAVVRALWEAGLAPDFASLQKLVGIPPDQLKARAELECWDTPGRVKNRLTDLAIRSITDLQETAFKGALTKLATVSSKNLDLVDRFLGLLDKHQVKVMEDGGAVSALLLKEVGEALGKGIKALRDCTTMIDDVLGISVSHKLRAEALGIPRKPHGNSRDPVDGAKKVNFWEEEG